MNNIGTLYLDFDGVLNSKRSRSAVRCHFHLDIFESRSLSKDRIDFDDGCISALVKLQRAKNLLNIVVTSSWRLGCKPEHFTELFNLYGIPYKNVEVLPVGDYADESPKGFGIRGLLVQHHIVANGITEFVCIDDTVTHYNYFKSSRVIFTDHETGLTIQRVNEWLDGEYHA